MIYTGNYDSCFGKSCVSISGDRGKGANFNGRCYPKLAPKYNFWKIWHDNLNIWSEDESTEYYTHEYYLQVLKDLDPKKVLNDLDGSVLLCYENNLDFCHRHIVSYWLEITLGIDTCEIQLSKSGKVTKMDRPAYIKHFLLNELEK